MGRDTAKQVLTAHSCSTAGSDSVSQPLSRPPSTSDDADPSTGHPTTGDQSGLLVLGGDICPSRSLARVLIRGDGPYAPGPTVRVSRTTLRRPRAILLTRSPIFVSPLAVRSSSSSFRFILVCVSVIAFIPSASAPSFSSEDAAASCRPARFCTACFTRARRLSCTFSVIAGGGGGQRLDGLWMNPYGGMMSVLVF